MSRVEPSPTADATLRAIGAAVTLPIGDVDPAGLAELDSYGWVYTPSRGGWRSPGLGLGTPAITADG